MVGHVVFVTEQRVNLGDVTWIRTLMKPKNSLIHIITHLTYPSTPNLDNRTGCYSSGLRSDVFCFVEPTYMPVE